MKIALIVSSDEDIRERFAKLLNQVGASYILERDRTKALMRVLTIDLRIIIVDMNFEMNNGLNFIQIIKKVRPRLPIIAITENSSKENYNNLLDAGAMYCLIKPVMGKELINVISGLSISDSGAVDGIKGKDNQ